RRIRYKVMFGLELETGEVTSAVCQFCGSAVEEGVFESYAAAFGLKREVNEVIITGPFPDVPLDAPMKYGAVTTDVCPSCWGEMFQDMAAVWEDDDGVQRNDGARPARPHRKVNIS